jgi:hypothetical protein
LFLKSMASSSFRCPEAVPNEKPCIFLHLSGTTGFIVPRTLLQLACHLELADHIMATNDSRDRRCAPYYAHNLSYFYVSQTRRPPLLVFGDFLSNLECMYEVLGASPIGHRMKQTCVRFLSLSHQTCDHCHTILLLSED